MIPQPPAAPFPPSPLPPASAGRSGPPVWALVLGGCGVVLVLVAVLVVVGAFGFIHNFQAGKYSCLPKDFPVYPGASYQSVNSIVGTGGSQCKVGLDATASIAQVQDYYQTQLGSGGWKVLGNDGNQGVLSFGREDSTGIRGTVAFLAHGAHTTVEIELDS